jgi:hypothetical protein
MSTSSTGGQQMISPHRGRWRLRWFAIALCGSVLLASEVLGQPLVPVEGQPVIPPPPAGLKTLPDKDDAKQPASTKAAGNSPPAEAIRTPMPALPPDFIRLYLMDGSVLAGRLSIKEVAVETQFGKLSVPVANIKSITPGLMSHPALAKELTTLVADLGSSNYNDREKAKQALTKMGASIRDELERHQNDADLERRNRIKAILTEFDQQAEDLEAGDGADSGASMRQGDTVETTEFTIVGRIVPQSFTVTSLYGDLNVKLADIRRGQRDIGKRDDLKQTFSVDASHLAMRNTLNTNLRIERGDIVTVQADGTITMTPWGAAAVTTPDGAQNYGWFIPGSIPSGALVGKIGNDSFRKLGSKSTFTAERSGVLQLAIGMQADYAENQFPGKYTVKVRVQRK